MSRLMKNRQPLPVGTADKQVNRLQSLVKHVFLLAYSGNLPLASVVTSSNQVDSLVFSNQLESGIIAALDRMRSEKIKEYFSQYNDELTINAVSALSKGESDESASEELFIALTNIWDGRRADTAVSATENLSKYTDLLCKKLSQEACPNVSWQLVVRTYLDAENVLFWRTLLKYLTEAVHTCSPNKAVSLHTQLLLCLCNLAKAKSFVKNPSQRTVNAGTPRFSLGTKWVDTATEYVSGPLLTSDTASMLKNQIEWMKINGILKDDWDCRRYEEQRSIFTRPLGADICQQNPNFFEKAMEYITRTFPPDEESHAQHTLRHVLKSDRSFDLNLKEYEESMTFIIREHLSKTMFLREDDPVGSLAEAQFVTFFIDMMWKLLCSRRKELRNEGFSSSMTTSPVSELAAILSSISKPEIAKNPAGPPTVISISKKAPIEQVDNLGSTAAHRRFRALAMKRYLRFAFKLIKL